MKKFLRQTLFFAFGLLLLAVAFDVLLTAKVLRSRTSPFATWNDLYQRNIEADVLVMGSSRAFVQFNPAIFDTVLHTNSYNPQALELRIAELIQDDDVTNQSGIYEYLLSGNEKTLNIRAFSDRMKQAAYERQKGICAICHQHFELDEMEADHIDPWHDGGKTCAENCQMLCRPCNRRKSGK